jgi:hypothetical protein
MENTTRGRSLKTWPSVLMTMLLEILLQQTQIDLCILVRLFTFTIILNRSLFARNIGPYEPRFFCLKYLVCERVVLSQRNTFSQIFPYKIISQNRENSPPKNLYFILTQYTHTCWGASWTGVLDEEVSYYLSRFILLFLLISKGVHPCIYIFKEPLWLAHHEFFEALRSTPLEAPMWPPLPKTEAQWLPCGTPF